jgi:lipopolysaccharide biosynthesis regulator YciM
VIPAHDLVPLAGMLTGVLTVGALSWGLVRIFNGPVGQALAKKITGKVAEQDAELVGEVLEMRHQLEQMHRRLGETEERLDFSERLLAQRSETPAERPN